MNARCVPVTIRDVTYPSAAHAAAALGCSVQHIYNAKSRGALDSVGSGVNGWAWPVRWRGQDFPSIAALARFTGRKPDTVSRYLDMDRLDDLTPRDGSAAS